MVAAGLLAGQLFSGEQVAKVGEPAPNFAVDLLDGGTFDLHAQLRKDDRPILINVWASWCLPCRVETPEISAFSESHPEVLVIGIAVRDTESQARRFAEQFSPSYDLAMGNNVFSSRFPTFGLPSTFLVEADGTVGRVVYGIVNTDLLEEMVRPAPAG